MSLAARANFKQALQDLIEEVNRRRDPSFPPEFMGEHHAPMLEHNVRKAFLDEFLVALGWNLKQSVAEEARLQGKTTLFLDYLGVQLEARVPLLIFEAKAWDKPFVSSRVASGGIRKPNELIALGLDHIKGITTDSEAPLIGEWMEWLSKLREYVRLLKEQSDHLVTRVAISSGQWLVIFTEPAAFVSSAEVNPTNILVFRSTEFVSSSDDIFGQIAYERLAKDDVPFSIQPTQLRGYASGSTVRRIFRALWVQWQKSGSAGMQDTYPQIIVYPVVVVERSDSVLLSVADRRFGRHVVPGQSEDLPAHLSEVEEKSNELIASICQQLEITIEVSELAVFPGYPMTPVQGSSNGLVSELDEPQKIYVKPWPASGGEYVVVTGTHSHFLMRSLTIDQCQWHHWGTCATAKVSAGFNPIFSASIDPKAYFASGSERHCSHIAVHHSRESLCSLRPFEGFMCCRACTLQDVCWTTAAMSKLPCGT